MSEHRIKPKDLPTRRKGVYLLPNLFTLLSLFSGFYAIVAAMHNQFDLAAIAILVAMVFDSLDGRVARLIKAQSAFGAELDSLSDMVSFGVSPALVAYNWSLSSLGFLGWGKLGWLTAFLYVSCVALRLARFNTQADLMEEKRYFFGLPCPAAAAVIATTVWVGYQYDLSGLTATWLMVAITWVVALLQVTNIRYRSFKDINFKGNIRFAFLFVLIVIFIFIALRPMLFFLVVFALFAISGPVVWLYQALRQLWVRKK